MPAITLIVTNAGRAALVDAATAGTFAVRIAEAGLTASAFTPLATATTLPGEFARIAGVSGSAIDPDTITLVIRDDSTAIYTLRGLGLFLDDGTLFAIYSQPTAILEKAANSTALIVLDVRFADIDATSLTFGDANFLNPPATTSVQGVIEIATDAEAIAGVDAVRAITPASLKALIDNRFGTAAASAFVRTLLTAATAAAFRLTLGLKSAALKDEGSGNGLDADTLDGHHLRIGANAVTWPGVPFVQPDGVMEIGSRIDFHNINNDPADFTASLMLSGTSLARSGHQMWDAGNDGSGSGLDADLLDGQDGGFYTNIVARLGYTPANNAGLAGLVNPALARINLGIGDGASARAAFGFGNIVFNSPGDFAGSVGLGGLTNPALARSNLGIGDGASARAAFGFGNIVFNSTTDFAGSVGLGGLTNPALARTNLGLGSAAQNNTTDFAAASHTHVAADLAPAFTTKSHAATGYQLLPGGLMLQWGQVRSFSSAEGVGPYVAFPTAFAENPFSLTVTPVNNSGSIVRDLAVQTTSRTVDGFNTFYQGEGAGGDQIDGFDWFAIGRA